VLSLLSIFTYLVIFSIFSSLVSNSKVSASINNTINFQSKIVNKTNGLNVSAGSPACVVSAGSDTCNFRVRVWNIVSGGSVTTGGNLMFEELFTGANAPQLHLTNGIFNLSINSVCLASPSADGLTSWSTTATSATLCNMVQDSLNSSAGVNFNRSDLWLEIAFDPSGTLNTLSTFNASAFTEVFSRTNLRSVPSAFVAQSLGGISANGFVQLTPSSPQVVAVSNTNSLINLSTNQTSSTNPLILVNEAGTGRSNLLDLRVNNS